MRWWRVNIPATVRRYRRGSDSPGGHPLSNPLPCRACLRTRFGSDALCSSPFEVRPTVGKRLGYGCIYRLSSGRPHPFGALRAGSNLLLRGEGTFETGSAKEERAKIPSPTAGRLASASRGPALSIHPLALGCSACGDASPGHNERASYATSRAPTCAVSLGRRWRRPGPGAPVRRRSQRGPA